VLRHGRSPWIPGRHRWNQLSRPRKAHATELWRRRRRQIPCGAPNQLIGL